MIKWIAAADRDVYTVSVQIAAAKKVKKCSKVKERMKTQTHTEYQHKNGEP